MQPSPSGKYLIEAICGVSVLLSTDWVVRTAPALAQITSDGSFNTLVNQSATDSCAAAVCEITGGQLTDSGSLLLHSFDEFSLPAASGPQSALFIDPGVADIVVRVTGNRESFINGTLAASTGSTANLFLVNSQGISFGPQAQLNLGGDFTSSTASEILFDGGIRLASNTVSAATSALLTVSQPVGLGFLADAQGNSTSGPITVNSTGNLLVFGSRDRPADQFVNRQFRQSQAPLPPGFPPFSALAVEPNNTIRLIGNQVTLSGGNLIAAGGKIEIGSVGVGDVIFAEGTAAAGGLPTGTLSYKQVSELSDIALTNSSSLDVSAPNPGQIFLDSRNLSVSDRSAVLAETIGDIDPDLFTDGGLIDINATDLVQVSNVPRGTPGGFPFFSYLSVDAAPGTRNPGGQINVQAQNLTITDGAQFGANTFGDGQAGKLQLTVDNTLSLLGLGDLGPSALFSSSAALGTGNAGQITIDTGELLLQGGSRVSTTSETTGATGGIDVKANRVRVEGTTPLLEETLPDGSTIFVLESSAIETDNRGLARSAGSGIEIESDQVLVTDGGQITAATAGDKATGDINITADEIMVSGRASLAGPNNTDRPSVISTIVIPQASGSGSDITLNSRQLSVLEGGQISTGTAGSGAAGDLTVNSESVLISGQVEQGRSGLFASAIFGDGEGGNLTVNTQQLQVIDGGTLSVSNFSSSPNSPVPSGRGGAGDLTVDARQIVLSNDAILNADTAMGDRGNITLTTETLTLRNGSRISTNASGPSTGGNININAASGFIVAPAAENSDITANAEFGDGGQVNIVAQDVLGIAPRPTLTEQSDITASSEFGAAGETQLETLETEVREDVSTLPESTDIPAVAQGCSAGDGGRFVQTGRGGTSTTPYGILNSRNSLSDVSLPNALAPNATSAAASSAVDAVVPLSTTNPVLTEAQGWGTNVNGEVVLFAADSYPQENARCLTWQS